MTWNEGDILFKNTNVLIDIHNEQYNNNKGMVSTSPDDEFLEWLMVHNVIEPAEVPLEKKLPKKSSHYNVFPTNMNNSCYIDSVLVALLMRPDPFTEYYVLNQKMEGAKTATKYIFGDVRSKDASMRRIIQKTEKAITCGIRGEVIMSPKQITGKVNSLRKLLGACNFHTDIGSHDQQDASDFLNMLLEVFSMNDHIGAKHIIVRASNDLLSDDVAPSDTVVTTSRVEDIGTVIYIDSWTSEDSSATILRTHTDEILDDGYVFEDEWYIRKITDIVYVPKNFFIIHIDRTLTGNKNTKPFELTEFVRISETHVLALTAVVLHNGSSLDSGHYITLFKSAGDVWYLYDDMIKHGPTKLRAIDFDSLASKYNMHSKTMLAFYSQ